MGKGSLGWQLRYIGERVKRRAGMERKLSKTAWGQTWADLPPGNKFLMIAPHPDDDVIGCGGTLAKLRARGKEVKVIYLTLQSGEGYPAETRRKEALEALLILGIEHHAFNESEKPSNHELQEFMEVQVGSYRPDTVLLPSPAENNQQHIQASLCYGRASESWTTRPDVMLFELWTPVIPNLLVDITDFQSVKEKAISAHRSQLKQIDFLRTSRAISQYRAAMAGQDGLAEAFLFLDGKQYLDLIIDQ